MEEQGADPDDEIEGETEALEPEEETSEAEEETWRTCYLAGAGWKRMVIRRIRPLDPRPSPYPSLESVIRRRRPPPPDQC